MCVRRERRIRIPAGFAACVEPSNWKECVWIPVSGVHGMKWGVQARVFVRRGLLSSRTAEIVGSKRGCVHLHVPGMRGHHAPVKVYARLATSRTRDAASVAPRLEPAVIPVAGVTMAVAQTPENAMTETSRPWTAGHVVSAARKFCSVCATDVPGVTGLRLVATRRAFARPGRWKRRRVEVVVSAGWKTSSGAAPTRVNGEIGR